MLTISDPDGGPAACRTRTLYHAQPIFNALSELVGANGNTEFERDLIFAVDAHCEAIREGALCAAAPPRPPSRSVTVAVRRALPPGVLPPWRYCTNEPIQGSRSAERLAGELPGRATKVRAAAARAAAAAPANTHLAICATCVCTCGPRRSALSKLIGASAYILASSGARSEVVRSGVPCCVLDARPCGAVAPNRVTAADISLYALLSLIEINVPMALPYFSTLQKFADRMAARPRIRACQRH